MRFDSRTAQTADHQILIACNHTDILSECCVLQIGLALAVISARRRGSCASVRPIRQLSVHPGHRDNFPSLPGFAGIEVSALRRCTC